MRSPNRQCWTPPNPWTIEEVVGSPDRVLRTGLKGLQLEVRISTTSAGFCFWVLVAQRIRVFVLHQGVQGNPVVGDFAIFTITGIA